MSRKYNEQKTAEEIVNREKIKQQEDEEEEEEEEPGVLSKIIGFFSGKTSNRESPSKQKKHDESSSPSPQQLNSKPLVETRLSIPYYAYDEIVDFRKRGHLNWLPDNQSLVRGSSQNALKPLQNH